MAHHPPVTGAVAVVGLGAMGSAIAARLLEAGRSVAVWNRTPARAGPLVDAGATLAATPAGAAARAATVIVMVSDLPALASVTEGADGIAAGIRPGGQVIVMSTVGPYGIERLRAALPSQVDLLDAPVLGSVGEATRGELTIFVGGDPRSERRAAPLLALLGTVLPVGGLGAGSAAKLLANGTLFGVLGLLGEALALGRSLGLTHETIFNVLDTTPLAAQARRRRPVIEAGQFPARFRLSLARKDADLVLAAASARQLDLPLARAARGWLAAAEGRGWGDSDYTAVLARILDAPAEG